MLVHQIRDLLTVDPCLDAGALGEHSVLVPLAILEVLVRFEFVCGSHPSSSGFTVDVPRLSAIGSTRFNLDLRTVDSPLRSALGLRANLHARIQAVVHLHLEDQLEVTIQLVRA